MPGAGHNPEAPTPPSAPAAIERVNRYPELSWDHSVGWEVHVDCPDPTRSCTRDPRTYLRLEYASLDDDTLFAMIMDMRAPLENEALIATADNLCHPNWIAYVKRTSPKRLLIRTDAPLSESEMSCLEALGDAQLYLGLCPDDGSTLWPCDGDAQLDALVKHPAVAARVVGLAVGFGEKASWSKLTELPNLEYLTVRGPASSAVDYQAVTSLCQRDNLLYWDSFDPGSYALDLQMLPECAFKRRRFEGDKLPPMVPSMDCRLESLLVWTVKAVDRPALLAACPALGKIEEAYPEHPR